MDEKDKNSIELTEEELEEIMHDLPRIIKELNNQEDN